MATAGTLVYSTRLDTSGMDRGLKGITGKVQGTGSTIKSILGGLGIAALVSKGIGAINSSMDGAIKRLDTMNNFPKVMSNLGIDADKSKKSIDKLSKGLQNVPTTLDDAALAVQRFASVNSDVEKSTDIFLAVNDAILAGGASSQIQSSALEQLSQAYSKGKPDMMEWRTIQMAMPAQLKQVATAMGYAGGNTAQLGEDLRSGKVSMDQFIGTIMDLDKEGVKGFQSFKTQAENSVGGVQTAIANMKTAITRGVAGALDSLDKALKDANLGGLSGVISSIGKAVESMLKRITPLISSVIKVLANVFNWMRKHQELVKTLAVAIGSFIGAFMLIQKVIAIINAVKTAFALLNVVMMANPIGLIIAGVAALIAILVVLYKKSETFRNGINSAFSTIKEALITAWNIVKPALMQLLNAIKSMLPVLKPVAEFLIKVLVNNIKIVIAIIGVVIKVMSKVASVLISAFANIISKLANFYRRVISVITSIINWFKKLRDNPKQAIRDLGNFIVNYFKQLPAKMLNIGLNIAKGIGRGITNGVKWIKDRISDMVGSVTKFIKKLFKIGSPSKLMADEVGQYIPAGIAVGIEANTDSALKSIDDMSNEMIEKLKSAVNIETSKITADANIKGNSFLNTTTVNSHVVADVYMDRTKVGQAVTPVVAQTIRKAGA